MLFQSKLNIYSKHLRNQIICQTKIIICWIQGPDIPQAGRGGAAHGEAAGRSGAGQDGTPTGRSAQETTVSLALQASRASKTTVLNDPWEARANEVLCKPVEEHDNRLTRGTTAALRSWLLTSGPSPICLCKPFSRKAYPAIVLDGMNSRAEIPAKYKFRFGTYSRTCIA